MRVPFGSILDADLVTNLQLDDDQGPVYLRRAHLKIMGECDGLIAILLIKSG